VYAEDTFVSFISLMVAERRALLSLHRFAFCGTIQVFRYYLLFRINFNQKLIIQSIIQFPSPGSVCSGIIP